MTCATDSVETRVLPFDGIHNFRDYGGYAVEGGGSLRTGMLYRSAQHKDATQGDLDRIAQLQLAAIIDLRSDAERSLSPCPRPARFLARVLFVPDGTAEIAPHLEAGRSVSDPAAAVKRMIHGYRVMPFRPIFMQAISQYFHALADIDGPTLIHCMAGKDRTGVAVATLHRALGVGRDEWLADYLLTNRAGNVEARIAAGASHVRAIFSNDLDDDTVRVLMMVRPEYIDSCFAAIDERYGSLAGYLRACGVEPAVIERVRQRLVA